MARIQSPLIGHGGGSVGNVTFSTWKGRNVLRAKPFHVKNPRTPAQVSQRNLFSAVGFITRDSTWILRSLAHLAAAAMAITESNWFATKNGNQRFGNGSYLAGTSGPNYFPTVDLTKAVWFAGSTVGMDTPVTSSPGAGQIQVTWNDNSNSLNPDALPTDNLVLIIVDHAYQTAPMTQHSVKPFAIFDRNDAARADADSGVIALPGGYSGKTVDVYVGFAQYDQLNVLSEVILNVSQSQYVGTQVIT